MEEEFISALINRNKSVFQDAPYRVHPGGLSVSRTIGDIEAKQPRFNGNPNVIIAVPEIIHFEILQNDDFIILGSDGIFDKLSNKEIIDMAWSSRNGLLDVHSNCAAAVDSIIRLAALKKSMDNLSVIMIAFSNYVVIGECKLHVETKEDMHRNLMLHKTSNIAENKPKHISHSQKVPNISMPLFFSFDKRK